MSPLRWTTAAALLGFTATLAQLALFRELSLLFSGHEIFLGFSLAAWVGGTAWGAAWIFPRLPDAWQKPSEKNSGYFGSLVLAGIFLALWAAPRVPREAGAPLGLLPMLFWVSALTVPLSAAGGLWYASLLAWVQKSTPALGYPGVAPGNPAQLWTWEAWGAGAAGLLYTGVLGFHWNSWAVAFALAGMQFFFLSLGTPARKNRLGLLLLAGAAATAALAPSPAGLRAHLSPARPGPGREIFSQTTARGAVSLVADRGMFSVYLQHRLAYAFPWPEQNEPPVLLPRLAGSVLGRVALVGGNPETIALLRRQPESPEVWAVIEDVQAQTALLSHLGGPWRKIFSDPHVHLVSDDGRHFFAGTPLKFDAVLLCLPLPETLALNRYYTRDFLQRLAPRLTASGVLLYALPCAPNRQLAPELEMFKALWGNLKAAFPGTALLAGEQLYFLASPSPELSSLTVHDLQNRARTSPGRSRTLTAKQIPLIFDESRRALFLKILNAPGTVANTDARPLTVHHYLRWWLAQQPLPALLLTGLGALLLPLVLARHWKQSPPTRVQGLLAWAGGLGLACEWLVIVAFQSTFGNIWEQIGLLFAVFMIGLGTGGWLGERARGFWKNARFYFTGLALLCAGGGFLISWSRRPGTALLVLGLAGFCVGALYAVLQSRAYAPDAVRGWSADLWGSAACALVVNTVLVPLCGYAAGALLAGAALAWFFAGEIKITPHPARRPGP